MSAGQPTGKAEAEEEEGECVKSVHRIHTPHLTQDGGRTREGRKNMLRGISCSCKSLHNLGPGGGGGSASAPEQIIRRGAFRTRHKQRELPDMMSASEGGHEKSRCSKRGCVKFTV